MCILESSPTTSTVYRLARQRNWLCCDLSVGVSVDGCLSLCWPCDKLATCPGCNVPSPGWMDGWKDFAVVFFAPQPRIKQMCKLTWEDGESEWEFSSVTRHESLCKHVHEWQGDLWCMNEWREIRDAVMSGEKEGGMIRRACKLCRVECGCLRLRGFREGEGGGGAFTDHRQRNTWEN